MRGRKVHWAGPGCSWEWTACGLGAQRRTLEVADELGAVTCLTCRRGAEVEYASRRDGVDYRRLAHDERRARAEDRRRAAAIVIERHREEYLSELALLRLARP